MTAVSASISHNYVSFILTSGKRHVFEMNISSEIDGRPTPHVVPEMHSHVKETDL